LEKAKLEDVGEGGDTIYSRSCGLQPPLTKGASGPKRGASLLHRINPQYVNGTSPQATKYNLTSAGSRMCTNIRPAEESEVKLEQFFDASPPGGLARRANGVCGLRRVFSCKESPQQPRGTGSGSDVGRKLECSS
jgi:hypothetical protein